MFNKELQTVGAAIGRPLMFLIAAVIAVHVRVTPAWGQDADITFESIVETIADEENPFESVVETAADDGETGIAETTADDEKTPVESVAEAIATDDAADESVVETIAGDEEVPVVSVVEITADSAAPAKATVGFFSALYAHGFEENFLSARLEYLSVTGVVGNIGLTAEVGVIHTNGLLLSADISGGPHNWGIGANAGYKFNLRSLIQAIPEDIDINCAAGGWVGYRSVALPYNLNSVETGNRLWRKYGNSATYGGLFLKLEHRGIELINRLQFGNNRSQIKYDEAADYITSENGFGMIYSIGLGYIIKDIPKTFKDVTNFFKKEGGK